MKINRFYVGAFAAVLTAGLFASCSDDNSPISPEDNGSQTGEKYIAVNIMSPGTGNGSRAIDNTSYEAGDGSECNISAGNLYFYFYDKDGNPFTFSSNVNGEVSSNMIKPTEIKTENIHHADGTTTTLTSGILVLGKPTGEGFVGQLPAKILCIANPTPAIGDGGLKNVRLKAVLQTMSNRPDRGWNNSTGTFMMSNSVYYDSEGKKVDAVTLNDDPESGDFKSTVEAATSNPVTIYIERVVAKVRATGFKEKVVEGGASTYKTKYWPVHKRNDDGSIVPATYSIDNTEKNLVVELTGWKLCKVSSTTYIVKNLDDNIPDPEPFPGFNDANRHRSYWAISSGQNSLQDTYDIYDETQFYKTEWMPESPLENVDYCYENTIFSKKPASANDRKANATAIVVRAVVRADKGDGTYSEGVDMFYWAGSYYTERGLKLLAIDNYNGTLTGDQQKYGEGDLDRVNIVPDDGKNTYHLTLKLRDEETTKTLDAFTNIYWWKNGVTSYYANIEQYSNSTTDTHVYGVVRNHIYQYDFNNVVGLGVPGNIVDNPDFGDETFLSAQIYCLNWHVVKNSFTLE